MDQKTLSLYDIEIPWFYPDGHLILAVPLKKRPPKRDKDKIELWNLEIKDALLNLNNGGEYEVIWDWSKPVEHRRLLPVDSNEEKCEETFKLIGWQHLVLPTGYTFGFKEEHLVPMLPNRNINEWPHDFWGLRDILKALENGGTVLQFHPSGLASAGYLAAIISAMADPQIPSGKIVYHVLHDGLGLNAFHYGIMLGMDDSFRRR